MRYIEIPADVHCTIPGSRAPAGVVQTFVAFVQHLLDTDHRFNATGKGVRSAVRIEDAVRRAKAGEWIAFEEDDWQLLRAVTAEPSGGYPTLVRTDAQGNVLSTIQISRQLVGFMTAIEDAKSEKPAALVTAVS